MSFIEEESVPSDTFHVGQTWKKANKDGSRDRRFANNYEIPVVQYGQLRFASSTGVNEEYLVSDATAAQVFAVAYERFRKQVPRG